MKIKEYQLNLEDSQKIHDEIVKVKPLQLNQCYFNTFAVATMLSTDRAKSRKYKVAYGFMKVIGNNEEGYEDWQYRSFVRHAFIVDDKNKVVDVSYIHLNNIKPSKPPTYLIMKKYAIDEYMGMVMESMKNNPSEIDLVWENGVIKNEELFKETAGKEGYVIMPYLGIGGII